MPPPSVSHTCGWSLANSHQSRVAARRAPVWAEGSGRQPDHAPFIAFLSPHLFQLSWHVAMYGPHDHLLAIGRLLVDWLYLPKRWQGHGCDTAVVSPRQKHRKTRMLTHKHSHRPAATCLDWHMQGSGHPAWCICGWEAKGDPLQSLGRKPEVQFAPLTKAQKIKATRDPVTAFPDSPLSTAGSRVWRGAAGLQKSDRSDGKSVSTYRLKTKSLYLLTIPVKMKDRTLAKSSLCSFIPTDGRSS